MHRRQTHIYVIFPTKSTEIVLNLIVNSLILTFYFTQARMHKKSFNIRLKIKRFKTTHP